MAFIDTIAPQDAEDEVLAMYERQQGAWGYVPNYAKVFSRRPEVLARWGRLLAEIRRPMSDRRFELVTFVVAYALRNSGCTLVHGNALAEFIGHDAVGELARGGMPGTLSAAEAEIVRFSRKIAADASMVTANDVAALRANGVSDAEVFDIAAAAAGRSFLAKLLDALGSVPDEPLARLDADFLAAVAIGRPVSGAPVERLPEP